MALYKFQSANMNSLTALRTHSLFFSKLEKLNDPTENMFGILPSEENIDPRINLISMSCETALFYVWALTRKMSC